MEHWLSSSAASGVHFETTQWSLVSRAGADGEENRSIFESLYRSYSHPVYAFLRRRGYNRYEAQDLTQDFFLHLLQKDIIDRADPLRGKFRTFLLTALGFFLLHVNERARAEKRGGDATMVVIDNETAETLYQLIDPGLTAEQIFDARWVSTLLQATIERLKTEMESTGKRELFDNIRCFLIENPKSSYTEAAQRTGLTVAALKTTIHRLRVRYRDLLRAEIARTVVSPADFDDEVRALRASLQSGGLQG
ncbi:MAG: sigma-70 family RNA polymerase sigma factor [Verrucomicrobia bacterium]|nr:sigma-70 family RNA polymerase sigma factor [Verrucomicrobiota bacterium]